MKSLQRYLAMLLLLVAPLALAQESEITILFTSDLHGSIRGYNYYSGEPSSGGLAVFAEYVKEIRAKKKNVLVLDGGDAISGFPNMFVSATSRIDEANPLIAAMNTIGYDAMAVGNHEFDFGLDYASKREKEADFPWLAANILRSESGEPAFQPYKLLEVAGYRVGILGFVTHLVPTWIRPEYIEGLEFEDPREVAQVWVDELRNTKGCDVVVILIHSGFERSKDKKWIIETPGENVAYHLSTTLKGVDVLLAGHSHAGLGPWKFGDVLAANCSAHALKAVRIDLQISRTDSNLIIKKSGELVDLSHRESQSADILKLSEKNHRETEALLNQHVVDLADTLEMPRDRLSDNRLMDILNVAQMRAADADISFVSLLPWNGFKIEAGPVDRRRLFALIPFETQVIGVEATGAQIKQYLEYSARFYDSAELVEGNELSVRTDNAIAPWNVDFGEGISYRIDPMQPEGSRIYDLSIGGRPLEKSRRYKVATNSYRIGGGGGYHMFDDAPVYFQSKKNLREIVIDFFANQNLEEIQCSRNWYISPRLVTDKSSYLWQ